MNVTSPSATQGATTGALSPGAASAELQGQLAKCETQLSDWVHCVSAATPEGKAKIAALSARVDDLKLKIDQTDAAKSAPAAAARTPAPAPQASPLATAPAQAISTLGGLVDAYA